MPSLDTTEPAEKVLLCKQQKQLRVLPSDSWGHGWEMRTETRRWPVRPAEALSEPRRGRGAPGGQLWFPGSSASLSLL